MSSVYICLLSLLVLVFSGQAEEPLEMYICAGQSNMLGVRSDASLLPLELQTVQEDVQVFEANLWESMRPLERIGPEISFAYEMQKTRNCPIGIIKLAVGGTTLAKNWNPDTEGPLYSKLKARVAAAGKSRDVVIKGMIWMQGEHDSKEEEMAAAYQQNLGKLIDKVRRDFESPEMVFVAGRVNPRKGDFPFSALVRKAQEECRSDSYQWVDCDDLPKHPDNIHYTTPGQVELGRRFAVKVQKLYSANPE